MATTPPIHTQSAGSPAPLTPLLLFVFVSSLGTGAITHGAYFLTESALGYGRTPNYALAAMFGAIYILSAAGVGPALRRIARLAPWLSTRALLGLCVGVITVACLAPWLTRGADGAPRAWSLWVLLACYAGATGVLWPVTESFVSGGRTGRAMRWATGRFNIAWSSATLGALLLMGPLVESAPLLFLGGVGLAHVLTLPLLRRLPREPAREPEGQRSQATAQPDAYLALLRAARVLLPVSYLYSAALIPQLPTALQRLGVDVAWKPAAASVYLLARLVGFVLFERWHAWHGRASMLAVGALLLLTGFAATIVSPELSSGMLISQETGRGLLLGGLGAFGLGASMIYASAIYYAMAAGSASVDAGGTHEALIGCGYTLGPLCGLAAITLAPLWGLQIESTTTFIVIFVSIVAGIAGWRLWAGRGKLRSVSDV